MPLRLNHLVFRIGYLCCLMGGGYQCAWAQLSAMNNPMLPLKAEWISCPGINAKAYGVYHFRKRFVLAAVPATFIIHVSADQRYRLFVNGKPVAFGPARGDLRNWNYETINLAPFLQKGDNLLAAQVWNMGSGAPAAQISAQTAFILQGNSEAESVVNTNSSWRVLQNEAYSPEPFPPSRLSSYIVGSCDSVNFARYPFQWESVACNDDTWQKPVIEPRARYYTEKRILKASPIPPMEEKAEPIGNIVRVQGADSALLLKQFGSQGLITIPAHTSVALLIDRKVLTTGYPEIGFSGGSNARVKIIYAESLFNDKKLKENRNQVAGKNIIGYYDVFQPDGGSQRLFRPLWMRTYRFIQLDITTGDEPLLLNHMQSVFTAYPFQQNAAFTASDKTLEDIFTVGWRTARLCANETYMDCPYYEQLQYVGDTRIQALISLYVSGDDRLMRNAIEQFHQSQMPDGLTMDAYPAGGGKFIPPFSLFWISLLHDYSRYRNDPAFLRNYLVPMEAILQWFERRLNPHSGMLGPLEFWNFVDWSFPYKGIPPGAMEGNSAILSLHYVYTLEQAADLCRQFGDSAKAAYHKTLAAGIRKATYTQCYDAGRSMLADAPDKRSFSQHANIWAVLTNCVEPSKQQAVMNLVLNDTALVSTSLYYRFYLTRALKKAGMGDRYLQTLEPWKQMMALGLSTFPETLEPNVRSDCHAWSASPCYDFLATVCGIETGGPGFTSVRIEPHLGNLRYAAGSMPHTAGTIAVDYKRNNASITATITLPEGLNGTFILNNIKKQLYSGRQVFTIPAPANKEK